MSDLKNNRKKSLTPLIRLGYIHIKFTLSKQTNCHLDGEL